MDGREEKNSMIWNRGEFLFCIVVLWTAAIFQGYAIYQEWREETKLVDAAVVEAVTFMQIDY